MSTWEMYDEYFNIQLSKIDESDRITFSWLEVRRLVSLMRSQIKELIIKSTEN